MVLSGGQRGEGVGGDGYGGEDGGRGRCHAGGAHDGDVQLEGEVFEVSGGSDGEEVDGVDGDEAGGGHVGVDGVEVDAGDGDGRADADVEGAVAQVGDRFGGSRMVSGVAVGAGEVVGDLGEGGAQRVEQG